MITPAIDILFDTETRDPDDFFALCFLASHPAVHLRAVTVNPGTKAQIGVIRHALDRLGLGAVPVGARDPDLAKDAEYGCGKMFHDPLAACVAVDPTIAVFREVQVYREKGEWGSRLADGTGTFVATSVDREKFLAVLVAH